MSYLVFACLVLLSFVWHCCLVAAAMHSLDLSYQFHLTPKAIAVSSKEFLDKLIEKRSVDGAENHKNVTHVAIDVSNSNLGDKGLEQMISSILSYRNKLTNCSMNMEMYFKAQMNGLTAQGVATFLNRILISNVSTTTSNATAVDSFSESIKLQNLDFGWNLLYNSASSVSHKTFHTALFNLLAGDRGGMKGLKSLCLSCTGLGPTTCRILAKGLLSRFESSEGEDKCDYCVAPMSLYLSYNRDIGDAGTAAFAAMIRRLVCNDTYAPILDTLDLSACDIGDVGVEALALALEDASSSVMIRNLVLCHNRISDTGALSLGRALHRNALGGELHVDLSDNPLISDQGISTLLSAVEKSCLTSLKLRSCSIQADGTELVGKVLRSIACNPNHQYRSVTIDLSGNPIGILRGKSEKSSLYSASALKSKASATASAYMSQGLRFLKKGFGSIGVSSSVESDDEEEKQLSSRGSIIDSDKSENMRCGFKSLAKAFLGAENHHTFHDDKSPEKKIFLGLRRTFCDSAGADALAAMLIASKDHYMNVELDLDLRLNPVVEEDMINALQGKNNDLLVEMAERHTEAMEVLRLSHERAVAASRAVAARRKKVPSSLSNYEEDPDDYPEDFNSMYEPVLDVDSNDADSDAEYENAPDDY
jgi:hypothetical protein